MSEKLLGHDLDGQRIAYWAQVNAWTDREEFFIELAPGQHIRLHHVEPGLLELLRKSLTAQAGPVAA